VEPLVQFITDNLVLTPNEALEEGVIDFVAETVEDLLVQIVDFPVHGSLGDGSRPNVTLADADIFYVELSISERFTNFMSDPTLSYILLMVGMYGLIFGFMSPGTYVPETLGAICIILALFGLGIVGANLVGILLLIMGMIFLFAEAATPTFGLFTTAAVICFVIGVLFVPPRIGGDVIPTFYLPRQWYTTFTLTSLTLIAGFVAFFVFGMQYVVKGRNRPSRTGGDELMGMTGRTVRELDPKGQIRLRGELWTATTADGESIPAKTNVRIVGRKGLTLIVEEAEQD
jgi:membrane-bound serine protease (ClpP class)